MKKSITLIAALAGILFAMGGCSREQAKSQEKEQVTNQVGTQKNDQVRDDLAKYLSAESQAMKPWSSIDKMTDELTKAKSAKKYVSILRKEFVPLVTGVTSQMEAIKPATKEVQDIHNAYLSSIKEYLTGLKSMAEAVENNDNKLVSASEVKLNAFAAAHAKFLEETNALANKNNIQTK
ncbi:MAG TPA: hypothetical protein VFF53_08845 [Geobacteraceae bacterium]|nr:hypothetical protein [Geobacteraceae bacterium]